MKIVNFAPLLKRPTRQDSATHGVKAKTIVAIAANAGLLIIVFMACASLLLFVDESAYNTPPFWLAASLLTFLIATWWHFYIADDRNYLVRLKKFAAINNFSYAEKVERKQASDEPKSVFLKAEEYCTAAYDAHVIKGKFKGLNLRFGVHTAEYPASESGINYLRVAFLELKRKENFPHILIVGEGRSVPRSVLKRLWALPQPIETDFQQYFQIYQLEGKKNWKEVIPPELQNGLLRYAKDFDIEIKGKTINFYQKNRFDLRKIERSLELMREFK